MEIATKVISLYTSIPDKLGLEALEYFLTTCQEDLRPRIKGIYT